MNDLETLLQRGQAAEFSAAAGAQQVVLTAPEAERMIESLSSFNVEDVGSAKYMNQHEWVEKLNLQAHFNAQARRRRRPSPAATRPPPPAPA